MNSLRSLSLTLLALATLTPVVSHAATLEFSPSTGTFVRGCPVTVNVVLDTQDNQTTASDVKIIEQPSIFTINSFDYDSGVFKAYSSPIRGTTRDASFHGSQYLYFLGTTASAIGFQGRGDFGALTFTPRAGINDLTLSLYYVPGLNGEDSNVAEINDGVVSDGLTNVVNGQYHFVDGTCTGGALPEISITDKVSLGINKNFHQLTAADNSPSSLFSRYGRLLLILLLAIVALFYNSKKPAPKKVK